MNLPEESVSPAPYHVKRGSRVIKYVPTIYTSRKVMGVLNESTRVKENLKPDSSPHYIQYTHVPRNILRYEDLFDHELTQTAINLLSSKSSLQSIVDDMVITSMTGGSISLADTYAFIESLDERDKLDGLTIRKLCVDTIRSYLLERWNLLRDPLSK